MRYSRNSSAQSAVLLIDSLVPWIREAKSLWSVPESFCASECVLGKNCSGLVTSQAPAVFCYSGEARSALNKKKMRAGKKQRGRTSICRELVNGVDTCGQFAAPDCSEGDFPLTLSGRPSNRSWDIGRFTDIPCGPYGISKACDCRREYRQPTTLLRQACCRTRKWSRVADVAMKCRRGKKEGGGGGDKPPPAFCILIAVFICAVARDSGGARGQDEKREGNKAEVTVNELYLPRCRRLNTLRLRRLEPHHLVQLVQSSARAGMKGRGNGRSSIKPTNQWHSPARFPHAKSGSPRWEASSLTHQATTALYITFAISLPRVRHLLDGCGPPMQIITINCTPKHGPPLLQQKAINEQDKVDLQLVYTNATCAIGSQFIRHTMDDSEPIADLQGNT
ncbi:hypothetical protein PR048_004271 [Dryococelus australis]|uniref:Uncharacterized protein n=1 Tax=Dryococelus australis TaxID=614101 RepID=A0ABQ9I519_9NEOP|nr:hypothetical protein PR048_004271 [Dryococelus australis]